MIGINVLSDYECILLLSTGALLHDRHGEVIYQVPHGKRIGLYCKSYLETKLVKNMHATKVDYDGKDAYVYLHDIETEFHKE